jgi:hypothetical protein
MVFSGCTGAGDATVAPTTSMMMPPAPKVLESKDLDACPPAGQPPVTYQKTITVDDGYDTLVIAFHATGEGQVTRQLRSSDSGKVVWGQQNQMVNTLADGTNCGDHSHKGGGDTLTVEPGLFALTMSYTGAVSMHIDITERSSQSNDTGMHMDH